ncbi:hypothetical protein B0H67DRAFT_472909, partial [Lasiosphaeris hirsuta]
AINVLADHIDNAPLDTVAVFASRAGELLSTTSDTKHAPVEPCEYMPLSKFSSPANIETIFRHELTELARFKNGVDKCKHASTTSPTGTEEVVFKYYYHGAAVKEFWNETNILLKLPRDLPGILHIDRLVVEQTDEGLGVLGFTTPFIPEGDFSRNKTRVFKLKWIKQLCNVIDSLNMRFNISHRDVVPRNLLLDKATDNILLCDFHLAEKVNSVFEQGNSRRDDVKGVVLTMHEIITRDPRYWHGSLGRQEEIDLAGGGWQTWIKHPEVQLEPGLTVQDYHDEVVNWAMKRRVGALSSTF